MFVFSFLELTFVKVWDFVLKIDQAWDDVDAESLRKLLVLDLHQNDSVTIAVVINVLKSVENPG